jgi:hypothetical protein
VSQCMIPFRTSRLHFVLLSILLAAAHVSSADVLVEAPVDWHAAKPPYEGDDFSAFAPFETTAFKIGDSELNVYVSSKDATPALKAQILSWVKNAAESITNYYAHYPVKRANLILYIDGTDNIHNGETDGGERIQIHVGRTTPESVFKNDWILTHEMFHLAFPDLDESYLWMEEGMAVYLEPIARARAGKIDRKNVWSGMVEGLPEGLPEAGDRGLARTATWGRTYWGGALFWFLADIEIRRQSQGKFSLDDAMRAILKDGGDGSAHWKAERVIKVGDAATEGHALKELFAQMATHPVATDLDALWKSLGVSAEGETIKLDDTAPLAKIREAITAGSH